MKSLTNFINESMINEATKGTLRDYMLWHFNLDKVEDLTYDVFAADDFDEKALNKYFNGDKKAMYDAIMPHIKNEKKINIDSQRKAGKILTKFKVDKFTINAFKDSEEKWHPEREIIDNGAKDKDVLEYHNQLVFKTYALNRMEKEGLLDKFANKKSWNFRAYGLFSFDHVTGYDCTSWDKQPNIKGLIADGSLTFGEAYDIVVDYFKKK